MSSSATPAHDARPTALDAPAAPDPTWAAIAPELRPLLVGDRLGNLVDLFALVADLVDFADQAAVEKLSKLFEDVVAAGATAGGALRVASAEARRQREAPPLRALWSLLRDPDTRRGVGMLLRALQIAGRLHGETAAGANAVV
ncbi:DUF1641 domain-containing protein [Burkholderia oklahomensis]|uniref:DUF1641 domain-containing protein n=1 Tax=Burkholderia oklahomensis TaxID=342113 RepID=UPI0005D82F70|nr:DUF1641 domain-containing protein [Burkholderia oklahomensis]AJX32940.1 hypothetical protein BG90_3609 [Burkholderia oklahomensis C6786]AOI46188.1 hypothetical protein WI23_10580 [Burkholderia oklahomensis C6786]KUY64132.1 hypothetical protein WI23_06675 [Burkholderia oklahomensis C6786]MBI0361236.1 DUF1641 domain-containing protein [Burkholderia oklahomensis]SUW55002.1 Uncharacterised protein [Burkholderia oklahomensis]